MKIHQPVTLASASPRRRELLAALGIDFSIAIPDIDETIRPEEKPRPLAERLAAAKAEAISAKGLIIAADTVVVKGDLIFGKPEDAAHARAMLQQLSNAEHEVITGVCIKNAERIKLFSVVTKVIFRALDPDEIEQYIATGEPMDKAGAYAVQGGASHMVRSISGSYTNVVGLPLSELYEALISF